MPWDLRVGAARTSVGDNVLPRVHFKRGADVGRYGVVPRAGTLDATLDASRALVGDRLALENSTGDEQWVGNVHTLGQIVDRQLNALRYTVHGLGVISQLVAAGSGYASDYYMDIPVDLAMVHLLVAAGIAPASYDVGSSFRVLSLWFIDKDVPLWRQALTLMRTAGPRARIYENRAGQFVFRDAALPTVAARTFRGRLAGVSGGAIVTSLSNDEPGLDRVINTSSIGFTSGGGGASVVGGVWGDTNSFALTNGRRSRNTLTQAQVSSTGVQPGDYVLLIGGGMGVGTISFTLDGWGGQVTDYGRVEFPRQQVGGDSLAATLAHGYVLWPYTGNPHVQSTSGFPLTGLTADGYAVVVRGTEAPALVNPGDAIGEGSILVSSLVVVHTGPGTPQVTPPPGFTLLSTGSPTYTTTVGLNGYRTLFVATGLAGSVSAPVNDWTVTSPTSRAVLNGLYAFPPQYNVVWQDSRSSFTIAADRVAFIPADSVTPFIIVVAPVAGTDYTVDNGSLVSVTVNRVSATRMLIEVTAGPNGATISGLQLRGVSLANADPQPATTVNATSVAEWGPRRGNFETWPHLDAVQATELANDIVDYSAQPRRSFDVALDEPRNASTLSAVANTEIGDRVRVVLDSSFDVDGEVIGVDERVEGASGFRTVTYKMLAANNGLPPSPLATAPGKPAPPLLTQGVDATRVLATWVAPDDGGAPITTYALRWRMTGTTQWADASITATNHTITGLNGVQEYEVQVAAINAVGTGPYSDSATITTGTGNLLLLADGSGSLLLADGSGNILLAE